jgi:arylsulfatase A-like enzyme
LLATRKIVQWRRLIAWLVGGAGELGPSLLVRYAFLLGAFGGAAEALYLTFRQLIAHRPPSFYYPEVLWMAPIAAALTYALLAGALGAIARAGRSGVSIAKATFVFSVPSIYAITQSPGIPLHQATEVVLSLGIAAGFARVASKRTPAALRLTRLATPAISLVLVVLLVWGITNLPDIAERRALGRLRDPQPGARNVLLIILDTVRAKNMGLYGYPRATTPHIDAWARSGVVFDRAITTAPWTLPSHATMFTGHYNHTIGTSFADPFDGRYPTLAQVLHDKGYATAAFTANLSYTARTSGLQRGFVRYEDMPVNFGLFMRSAFVPKVIRYFLQDVRLFRWTVPKRAENVTSDFLRWLEARPDRPFFAFLNYFDAHDPYECPPPHHDKFGPPPKHEIDDDKQYTTEELAPWINAYDGCINYIDDQLARIFELLETSGLRERTLVVITSDHGEMFGEHGQTQHTSGLYIPVLHVPLAMVFPNAIPAGARVSAPVTLRDLPATILDIAGVAADSPIPGASLAGQWEPGGGAGTESPLLAEIDYYGFSPWKATHGGGLKSLVDGRLHYIRKNNGSEELYDAVADPAEERDLTAEPQFRPALERLRAVLDSILR